MKVLVIQHTVHEGLGSFEEVLSCRDINVSIIRTFAGDRFPAHGDDQDGLIVLGGPMGVYEMERYPFLEQEKALISSALQAGVPILGICLGSELLASVLGAKVYPAPSKEIGWFPVTLTEAGFSDPLFSEVSNVFVPLHWHGDVFDLPSGAVSLATSKQTACQAFRWSKNAYGILCHLEVTPSIVNGMVADFGAELQEVHTSLDEFQRATKLYLSSISSVSDVVFKKWVDLVISYHKQIDPN